MKIIFFDLDNTLYDAEKYYIRAFNTIAGYIFNNFQIEKRKTFEILHENWKRNTSMYNKIFDDLIKELDLGIEVEKLVSIFNKEKIAKEDLFSDTKAVLEKLSKEYKIGLITDGNVLRQKRKIHDCLIEPLLDTIVYTKTLEAKPSPLPFKHALDQYSVDDIHAFYVADNPMIDFSGAKQAGFTTIRIVRGEFQDVNSDKYVDYSVFRLDEIYNILEL